jgi:hypothetical protein
MPGSSKWSLSLRFPQQNPVYASPLPHTRYMPRPSHSSQVYRPNASLPTHSHTHNHFMRCEIHTACYE